MVGRLCWGPTVGWCGLHTQSWAPCLRDGSRVQKELSHRWVPWIFWVPCQALAGDISFLWRNFVCTWSLLWRVAQSSDGLPLLVKVEDFMHFRTTSRAFASTKAERNTENGWRTVCFCLNHLNHSWGIGESFGAPLGASQVMIFACSNDLKMFDGVTVLHVGVVTSASSQELQGRGVLGHCRERRHEHSWHHTGCDSGISERPSPFWWQRSWKTGLLFIIFGFLPHILRFSLEKQWSAIPPPKAWRAINVFVAAFLHGGKRTLQLFWEFQLLWKSPALGAGNLSTRHFWE